MATKGDKVCPIFADPGGATFINRQVLNITQASSSSTERHGIEINSSIKLASGGGAVALNVAETTDGTAGAWACGIFAKITQGATKNVNGYLCAAEFELNNAAVNSSDFCVMALNSNVTTALCSHPAYVYLRDYGTTNMPNLLWIADLGAMDEGGVTAGATLICDVNAAKTHSHSLRILYGTTPYWIMLHSAAPD